MNFARYLSFIKDNIVETAKKGYESLRKNGIKP